MAPYDVRPVGESKGTALHEGRAAHELSDELGWPPGPPELTRVACDADRQAEPEETDHVLIGHRANLYTVRSHALPGWNKTNSPT